MHVQSMHEASHKTMESNARKLETEDQRTYAVCLSP